MPIETEFKYLVKPAEWAGIIPERSVHIRQAYLARNEQVTVRIRLAGDKAYLTIKGRSKGVSRPEFEFEIPLPEAMDMFETFKPVAIEKTRHYVRHAGHTWEVDVFEGLNAGLIIAEIELQHEDESYEIPQWVGDDVTHDKRYANTRLAVHPYSTWDQ